MTFMLMDIISTVTCHRFIINMAGAITSLFHGVNPIMKSGLFMLEFPVRRRDAPLLKQTYTGPETTSVGDLDFSPTLAKTKRDQQFLEKSGLWIFQGSSRFSLVKFGKKNEKNTLLTKYKNTMQKYKKYE